MSWLIEWILHHANIAHWLVFFSILLAGINLPISADLIILVSAFLAASVIPEKTWHLFFAVYFGCYFSAWIAYWIGRIAGLRLLQWRWFAKILNPQRLAKISKFHEKYGLLTLVIGRFIPFGMRNCIFMTNGISKIHFGKFILKDLLACFIWSGLSFYLFYRCSQNYEVLVEQIKKWNIFIFAAFLVSLIAIIWYKRRKKLRSLSHVYTNNLKNRKYDKEAP